MSGAEKRNEGGAEARNQINPSDKISGEKQIRQRNGGAPLEASARSAESCLILHLIRSSDLPPIPCLFTPKTTPTYEEGG